MAETVQEYTARILSLAGEADPLEVLATTPARVGALIAGRPVDDLRWSPAPGRWSIAEILAHLADAEIVFAYRVRMILSASGTPIQAYDQNDWSRAQRAEDSDPHASLALFAAIRASMVRLLESLSDEELDRYGVHAERGHESARRLMRLYSGHDRNHVGQIERLLEQRQTAVGAQHTFKPAAPKPEIDQATLEKLDVRVGTIRAAAPVDEADRLAALTVDFGDRTRTIVAGIRTERSSLDAIVGSQALFVVNLPPKTIRGRVSEGMLFDIGFSDGVRPAFAVPEWPVPDGVRAG
jgi:tRNA-binding protein